MGRLASFGTAVYNTLALFNHSCLPNLARVNRGAGVLVVTTRGVRCTSAPPFPLLPHSTTPPPYLLLHPQGGGGAVR